MTGSLTDSARAALERYLTHNTGSASHERRLLVRRARGFGLIGLGLAFTAGFMTGVAFGQTDVVVATLVLMLFIVLGLWAGSIRESRYIVPVTHMGMGTIMGGIFLTSVWIPASTEIGIIFPMLLILVITYVLGVKSAFCWTVLGVIGSGAALLATDPSVLPGEVPMTVIGLFAARSMALFGAFGFAAAERRAVDQQAMQLEYLAGHDSLTGLLNRRAFEERLDAALARARRYDRRIGLIMIDLDGFKPVNDIHGHAAGDALLRRLAQRIARLTRETDAVCRLGGDEFVVLVEDLREEKHVELHATRLLEALIRPMEVDGAPVRVGASLGVAIQTHPDDDAEGLMRAADQAMYLAKSDGGTTIRCGALRKEGGADPLWA